MLVSSLRRCVVLKVRWGVLGAGRAGRARVEALRADPRAVVVGDGGETWRPPVSRGSVPSKRCSSTSMPWRCVRRIPTTPAKFTRRSAPTDMWSASTRLHPARVRLRVSSRWRSPAIVCCTLNTHRACSRQRRSGFETLRWARPSGRRGAILRRTAPARHIARACEHRALAAHH